MYARRPPPSNQRIILILICILFGLGLAQYGPALWGNLPQANFFEQTATWDQLYASQPDLQSCQAGQLKNEEQINLLNHINAIRSLHDLPPLLRDAAGEEAIAAVALVRAANAETDNDAPTERCATGVDKALDINSLSYQVYQSQVGQGIARATLPTSESMIDSLLQDHRRGFNSALWLLNPFAETVRIGRADGRTDYRRIETTTRTGDATEDQIFFTSQIALHIELPEERSVDTVPPFIAYPYHDYPQRLFRKDDHQVGYPHLLFLLPEPQQTVDFAQAQIEIQDAEGNVVRAQDKDFSAAPTMLGHYLAWQVDDLEPETRYTVKVTNVVVESQPKDYSYWFRLTRE
ncbi:MAG: hypothetical protein ACPGVO_19360 [Spirulinaceae cyanobacterium]